METLLRDTPTINEITQILIESHMNLLKNVNDSGYEPKRPTFTALNLNAVLANLKDSNGIFIIFFIF